MKYIRPITEQLFTEQHKFICKIERTEPIQVGGILRTNNEYFYEVIAWTMQQNLIVKRVEPIKVKEV